MNVVGMDVQFWQGEAFVDIVTVLLKHGWQFYGGNIVYLPPLKEGEEQDWNWKVDSIERWLGIKQEIRHKQSLKETVGIKLEWPENECTIDLTLDAEYRLDYHTIIHPYIPSSKIPDFTWLLTCAVLPLERAKYNIREIRCSQDRS